MICSMAEKLPEKPKDIKFEGVVVDICCHPSKDVIATGDIGGEITLHAYSQTEENRELMKFKHHKKACRALRFSLDGEELYTTSKDKSIHILDLNTGTLKRKIEKAHPCPVYSMLVTGDNFVATGDDDGNLKVWDLRSNTAAMELKHNEEFISDMEIDDQRKILIATSGDGTLTAFNIRRKRMELQSELFDSELLSLAVIKGMQKVVCGSGEGVLNIFNWGEWGNISDRFPGHPMSVDCMVSITEDIICTGSSDGLVRAVNILPNRFLGVIGEHDAEFPVENLSLSHDQKWLASCAHDCQVKFWDIGKIKKEKINARKKAKKTSKPKYLNPSAKNDFFAGLDDSATSTQDNDDDDDDDDDSDNENSDD